MWRRSKQPSDEPSAGEQSKTSKGPRALSSIDELLRRAAWDGLSESERVNLLQAYPSFPAPASSEVSDISPDIRSSDQQDWVAALVQRSFQREATQVARSWLADGSPDAHLYLGGSIGQGRRSLVSCLSRQAMASRPT